jgi:hypothetical protein
METQNVQADKNGHYSVMLGSAAAHGLLPEVFVAGEARWLGVEVSGQAEQPRTLLLSVPYALKALDAETLGGKPASAFMSAPPSGAGAGTGPRKEGPLVEQPNEIVCSSPTGCRTGFVPLFSTSGGSAQVKDSIISQSGGAVRVTGIETVTSSASSPALTGKSSGTNAVSDGVDGITSSGTASGVAGINNGNGGVGVYGVGATGLYGSGGSGDGVFGATVTGFAGYFAGDVTVTGNLSKGGGSFKIDHPLDPANKYLYHSFVESPDMLNLYNGNATTDAQGEAVVHLPDWFETLNRDFRYQLTVMGQFAQAIVASEIANRQFTIKTDKPNVRVSWQVTGVRQDPWANAHRIPVEELKTVNERGLYLHPELYGAPPEKSITAHRHPDPQKLAKDSRPQPPSSAKH